jgi:hypothetical protein
VIAREQSLQWKAAGCRVLIHSPHSESAFVDMNIRQLKNVTWAIAMLPYAVPLSIVMYAVMHACSKINMAPNSSLAYGYSPIEMFLGRSVSVERDLGGRKRAASMPFESRCEIYDGTTNTIADWTMPARWLGSKSNVYGSGWLFYAGY